MNDDRAHRHGRGAAPTGGAAAALAVAGLAGVHTYWACGGFWPGNDPASLGETVAGPGAELRRARPCGLSPAC